MTELLLAPALVALFTVALLALSAVVVMLVRRDWPVRVAVHRAKPGDVVVITVPAPITEQVADAIIAGVKEHLPGLRVFVLDDKARLEVIEGQTSW